MYSVVAGQRNSLETIALYYTLNALSESNELICGMLKPGPRKVSLGWTQGANLIGWPLTRINGKVVRFDLNSKWQMPGGEMGVSN